ncbi:bifunctional adenosylcobinamide kinase/adenosylcobinamide-phosphate guanylyltransferase [Ideonella sp.]|uniref:bifunctional adenosylcobinamide kinase/adenosylcobinamide-phosphate guanylyltransferase n=1 Tax=Ideonella sp. TaxID=1929293 RepID=UPI00351B2345
MPLAEAEVAVLAAQDDGPRHTLLIGGARSGKSALAERRAAEREAAGAEVVVIATAQALDEEMAARIAAHRAVRPAGWRTVEAPEALAATLQAEDAPGRVLLVDCLTLWLSNLLFDADANTDVKVRALQPSQRWVDERAALLALLPTLRGELILIGNEVGHGIVPMGAGNRLFVDENGRLHQALAAHCAQVEFVMAGCALALKTS